MSWHDWYHMLLFFHVLAAFLTVTGLSFYWAVLAATGWGAGLSSPLLRLSKVADILWGVGSVTVLLLGIWLAIYVKGYEVWDGWVLAAIVLWAIAGGVGGRVGGAYRSLRGGAADAAPSVALHTIMAVAILALLLDMIYKPGA